MKLALLIIGIAAVASLVIYGLLYCITFFVINSSKKEKRYWKIKDNV